MRVSIVSKVRSLELGVMSYELGVCRVLNRVDRFLVGFDTSFSNSFGVSPAKAS